VFASSHWVVNEIPNDLNMNWIIWNKVCCVFVILKPNQKEFKRTQTSLFFCFVFLSYSHFKEDFLELFFPHCYICPSEMLQGLICNWYLFDPSRIFRLVDVLPDEAWKSFLIHVWLTIIITTCQSKDGFQCFAWVEIKLLCRFCKICCTVKMVLFDVLNECLFSFVRDLLMYVQFL